jgi:hypothetical protein
LRTAVILSFRGAHQVNLAIPDIVGTAVTILSFRGVHHVNLDKLIIILGRGAGPVVTSEYLDETEPYNCKR